MKEATKYDYIIIGSGFGGSPVYANTLLFRRGLFRLKTLKVKDRGPTPFLQEAKDVANPGVNPALSILAITERAMNLIPEKDLRPSSREQIK